jgi:ribosomal protein S18 acetylase RimI-like enzyme
MIRPIRLPDTPGLLRLAEETGVFKPLEMQALEEVLQDYHVLAESLGHRAIGYERDARLLGFAYYAPEDMTDRTWNLWWIVVGKAHQSAGIGTELLEQVENDIKEQRGRLLLIETSSLASYEPSRRFYRKHGYGEAAVLADYYADGDDMIVFRKRLA